MPFLVLAVVYVLGAIIGTARRAERRPPTDRFGGPRPRTSCWSSSASPTSIKLFVGDFLPYADWANRMWLGNRWNP